ncbi:glycoside hydrolase family 108 protein [Nitrosomonas communis]|uniref:Predicted Peptidoglycan domain-containing protein n=1 Tax=Nitrosomonas communis TaxID=44574 RepID=A0A1I4NBS1_9PROT|nr:glycosyl hydrolase 108 family protein [Nitrosomonas communis]SFM12730.1 Predicted Peptidoglycan domain-containing protein [Nitrosomonas communis]
MVETIIDDIIRREGSFINHPADRGGPTKYGITAKTLGGWRRLGRAATSDEVAALTEAEAREIYRQQYIVEPGFDAITHPALQALLVDSGVHSDPKTAVHWLQTAVGVAADRVIGPKTLAAIAAADQNKLYSKVLASRVRHLGRLITNDPKQSVFAAGWMNRMAEFVEGTV